MSDRALVRSRMSFRFSREAIRFGIVLAIVSSSLGFGLTAFAPWFRAADAPLTSNFLGNDFNSFLAAGRLALRDPVAAYDPAQMTAAIEDRLGRPIHYSWAYPPIFFFFLLPLAALPLVPALLLWWLATTVGLAAAATAATRIWWIAPAVLLFPATIVNMMMGQNGSLSALILLLGVLALKQRPLLAGAVFALLAYKPHLALLLPVGLAAGCHWRAFFSMAGVGCLLAAASLLAFGWQAWAAFLNQIPEHANHVLTGGLSWKRIPTPLVSLHYLTGSLTLATLAQSLSFVLALAGCAWVWRRTSDSATRAGAIAAGSFLASPYAFDYDLALLAVPAILLTAALAACRAGLGRALCELDRRRGAQCSRRARHCARAFRHDAAAGGAPYDFRNGRDRRGHRMTQEFDGLPKHCVYRAHYWFTER
jgi:alpha-1,2-mannosyltransferase